VDAGIRFIIRFVGQLNPHPFEARRGADFVRPYHHPTLPQNVWLIRRRTR
jgi:hypothetical protein